MVIPASRLSSDTYQINYLETKQKYGFMKKKKTLTLHTGVQFPIDDDGPRFHLSMVSINKKTITDDLKFDYAKPKTTMYKINDEIVDGKTNSCTISFRGLQLVLETILLQNGYFYINVDIEPDSIDRITFNKIVIKQVWVTDTMEKITKIVLKRNKSNPSKFSLHYDSLDDFLNDHGFELTPDGALLMINVGRTIIESIFDVLSEESI